MDEERGLLEVKLSGDIALNGGRGGGGERDDGCRTESRQKVAQRPVVGTEVMSPGGDAVGFVDGDERRFPASQHLGEAGNAHALGSDEEELEGAVEVVAASLAGVVAGESGVDARDAQAGSGELGGLVVHKRDERGDDEGGASAGDGG